MALMSVSTEEVKMKPGKHPSQFINATKRFTWIDYFDTEISSTEARTLVATLIIPVEDEAEAKQVVASKALDLDGSGNVTISFVKKGETYSFDFENRKGGLDLKN